MSPIIKVVVAWLTKVAWKKWVKPMVIEMLKWIIRHM